MFDLVNILAVAALPNFSSSAWGNLTGFRFLIIHGPPTAHNPYCIYHVLRSVVEGPTLCFYGEHCTILGIPDTQFCPGRAWWSPEGFGCWSVSNIWSTLPLCLHGEHSFAYLSVILCLFKDIHYGVSACFGWVPFVVLL